MIENSKGKMVNPAVVEHMAMENERLRGLLRDVSDVFEGQHPDPELVIDSVRNVLSQQAEPAPAQDEREAEAVVKALLFSGRLVDSFLIRDICKAVLATRPAQTDQQPVAWLIDWPEEPELGHYFSDEPNEHARSRPLYAAPIAQTAPKIAAKMPCGTAVTNVYEAYEAGKRAAAPQPEQSGLLPQELFDGYAVYQETVRHRRDNGLLVRTSPENVSDTLDAVARLIKARRAALSAQGTSK